MLKEPSEQESCFNVKMYLYILKKLKKRHKDANLPGLMFAGLLRKLYRPTCISTGAHLTATASAVNINNWYMEKSWHLMTVCKLWCLHLHAAKMVRNKCQANFGDHLLIFMLSSFYGVNSYNHWLFFIWSVSVLLKHLRGKYCGLHSAAGNNKTISTTQWLCVSIMPILMKL